MVKDARGIDIATGFRVHVAPRESSLGGETPTIHGVVTALADDIVTILDFKNMATRSARPKDVKVQRGWIKLMDSFMDQIKNCPGPNSRGRAINPNPRETEVRTAIRKMLVLYGREGSKYAAVLQSQLNGKNPIEITPQEKESLKMASQKTKSAKSRRSKVDFSDMNPGDFFTENKRGKVVFHPGYDAKLKSLMLKVIHDEASPQEKKLATSAVILESPKVAESAFFQDLVAQMIPAKKTKKAA